MTEKQTGPSLDLNKVAENWNITTEDARVATSFRRAYPKPPKPAHNPVPRSEHSLLRKTAAGVLTLGTLAGVVIGTNELAQARGNKEQAPWAQTRPGHPTQGIGNAVHVARTHK